MPIGSPRPAPLHLAALMLTALLCRGPDGAIPAAMAAPTGDTSRCHSIQNADQRHLCLALGKRESSRCHSIQDSDLRYGCLAQTQGQRSRCHSIQNRDQREMCLALVPRG